MSLEDKDKLSELLDYAPWVQWSVTPNSVPQAQLGSIAKPDSQAMKQLENSMEACKAVCMNVHSMFKELTREGVLSSPDAGSIPSIMKAAMRAANEMEKDHMQTMAGIIYDPDGTKKVIVKDVKEMLRSAAKATAPVKQSLDEAKSLVRKFRRQQDKKEKEREAAHQ